MNRDKSYFTAKVNNHTIHKISADSDGYSVNGKNYKWDLSFLPDGRIHIISGHKNFMAHIQEINPAENTFTLQINKELIIVEIKNPFDELLEKMGMKDMVGLVEKSLRAPMPGQIAEILVKEGRSVSIGDPLILLKAMKMENILKATANTMITKILVKEGDPVEKNQDLILFQ